MDVEYAIDRLGRLREVDLRTVGFQSTTACPVCEGTRLLDVSTLDNSLTSAWCGRCVHMFHRVRPKSSWYRSWYETAWDQPGDRNSNVARAPRTRWIPLRFRAALKFWLQESLRGRIFDFCAPATQPTDRVLDIGCGYGGQLIPFVKYGCKAAGIDPCNHRALEAVSYGIDALPIAIDDLDEHTFGSTFDLVFANHVLEHTEDLHGFLRRIKTVLAPEGWLCIAVPNLGGGFLLQDLFYGLHIQLFSRDSLLTLLSSEGFIVRRIKEDHEIMVLAQRRQYPPQTASDLPVIHASRSETVEDHFRSWVFERTLGPSYRERKGKRTSVAWSAGVKRVDQLFDIRYGGDRGPCDERAVQLSWDGAETLPMRFRSMSANGDAPFWVK